MQFSTLNFTKKKYEELDYPNQSSLKKLLIHPKEYIKYQAKERTLKEEYDKDYLILGSMVDCSIFEPQEFYNRYAIEKDPPTGQTLDFINHLIPIYSLNEDNKESISKAVELTASKKHKEEYFINAIDTTYKDYFENRINNLGKTFVSKDLNMKCSQIVNSVKEFERFSELCDRTGKNQELIYQKEIIFEFQGVKLKSKLDSIKIDHDNKKIFVCDLKTTWDYPVSFMNKFYEYGYDFQATFYKIAMVQYILNERPELSNYNMENFYFIVESTMHTGYPLAFNFTEQKLTETIDVVAKVIDDYKFYKINGFERKREEVEGEFLLTIK